MIGQNKLWGLIPAGGVGRRMDSDIPKQYLTLAGKSILQHSMERLLSLPDLDGLLVGISPTDEHWSDMSYCNDRLLGDYLAGEQRANTVLNGLQKLLEIGSNDDWVLVHDAVRPLLDPDDLVCLVKIATEGKQGGLLSIPMADTVKLADENLNVVQTQDRRRLWRAATPQLFPLGLLERCLRQALEQGVDITDEASALEWADYQPRLVPCRSSNIKITTSEDLDQATRLLEDKTMIRIGHGFDAHRLIEGRALMLGGIEVPYHQGLDGHSDADVLLHAICDAIIGAAGMGDIGGLFPDSDKQYRNISSVILLSRVMDSVHAKGYGLGNLDATVIAQAPKLAKYLPQMRQIIAITCDADIGQINLKATTTEKMGYEGKGEGISAHAVVVLNC